MEWVETTGRTLDDAREAALDELGVDAEDAEFEILEEPKQGLFGRLRSEARVRARVRPVAPPAKDDRRRQRRSGRSGSSGTKQAGGTSPGEADDRPAAPDGDLPSAERQATGGNGSRRRPQRGRSGGDAGAVSASEADPAPESAPPETPADDEGSGAERSRGGRSGGARAGGARVGGGRSGAPEGSGSADADGETAAAGDTGRHGAATSKGAGRRSGGQGSGRAKRRDRDEEGSDVDVALDEQAVVATEFLQGLVDEFGLTADIRSSQPDEDTLEMTLQGSDLGLLIGPKGSTLLAIQDLTRTVVQRKTGAGNGRIHVDVGGYRQKRAEALSRFAAQVADEVKRTGVRKALEPMSAPDRKVVHDALTDVDGVSTMSEGEDARRRVVISPSS